MLVDVVALVEAGDTPEVFLEDRDLPGWPVRVRLEKGSETVVLRFQSGRAAQEWVIALWSQLFDDPDTSAGSVEGTHAGQPDQKRGFESPPALDSSAPTTAELVDRATATGERFGSGGDSAGITGSDTAEAVR